MDSQTAARLAQLHTALAAVYATLAKDPAPVAVEPAPDRLLTIDEVATRLDLKPSYLYDLGRRGAIETTRVGKFVRVRESVVRDIEQGRVLVRA